MNYTTSKIAQEDARKLKAMKLDLERKDIRVTQPQLLHTAVELLYKNEAELIKKIGKTRKRKLIEEWAKNAVEGPKTNCVEEIDLIT